MHRVKLSFFLRRENCRENKMKVLTERIVFNLCMAKRIVHGEEILHWDFSFLYSFRISCDKFSTQGREQRISKYFVVNISIENN